MVTNDTDRFWGKHSRIFNRSNVKLLVLDHFKSLSGKELGVMVIDSLDFSRATFGSACALGFISGISIISLNFIISTIFSNTIPGGCKVLSGGSVLACKVMIVKLILDISYLVHGWNQAPFGVMKCELNVVLKVLRALKFIFKILDIMLLKLNLISITRCRS